MKGNITLCKRENNLVLFPIKIKLFAIYKQFCDSNVFNDFSHSVLIEVLSSIGRITNSVLSSLLNNSYRSKATSVSKILKLITKLLLFFNMKTIRKNKSFDLIN